MNKYSRLIIFGLVLIIIDQFSKYYITKYFADHLIINSSVIFGQISSIYIIYTIYLIGGIAIYILFKQANLTKFSCQLSLSLVLAGTLSNILDRLIYGGVVDFINFHIWPAFNLADIYIALGILLYLWFVWKQNWQ